MKTVTKILFAAISTCLAGASICPAQGFLDNYDSQPAQAGAAPSGYETFGSFTSVGVGDGKFTSPSNDAYLGINFGGGNQSFGAGLVHDLATPIDLTGSTLSVAILESAAAPAAEGYVAFYVGDSHGTIYRTPTAFLYNPVATFTTFSEAISDLQFDQSNSGNFTALDTTSISVAGFLAFNRGDNVNTTLDFDDFQAVGVPEPATWAASLLVLVSGLLVVRRRYRALRPQNA